MTELYLDDALPPVTTDDVIAERERRLSLGFDYDFGDERGLHRIGTTPADLVGWDEVTKAALARQSLTDETPILIKTETGACEVTPREWLQIMNAATAARQPVWLTSFALMALDPIPRTFALETHWTPAP